MLSCWAIRWGIGFLAFSFDRWRQNFVTLEASQKSPDGKWTLIMRSKRSNTVCWFVFFMKRKPEITRREFTWWAEVHLRWWGFSLCVLLLNTFSEIVLMTSLWRWMRIELTMAKAEGSLGSHSKAREGDRPTEIGSKGSTWYSSLLSCFLPSVLGPDGFQWSRLPRISDAWFYLECIGVGKQLFMFMQFIILQLSVCVG